MDDKDQVWKAAAESAAATPVTKVSRPRHAPPQQPAPPAPATTAIVAEAAIVASPILGAITIFGISNSAVLNDAPAIWINVCAGLAVGVTTLAAVVDRRDDEETDMASIIWSMLLIWPLAHIWLSASRSRLGKKNRVISAIAGSLALVAALYFGLAGIQQARNHIQFSINKASATFDTAAQRAIQARQKLDAEQAAIQERIDRLLDAEQ